MFDKKKYYVVNVNVDIPVEAYSIIGAELKVRDMFATLAIDWDINKLIVTEDEND